MGIRSALIVALSILSMPAWAQAPLETQPETFTPLPPLMDQVIGDATKNAITWDKFCNTLTQHDPSAGVTYQAGVDAHGNTVVPADLPGQQKLNLPDQYRVFLTSDQISKLGISIPGSPIKADTYIGQAVVGQDGRVTFNGQAVSTNQIYTVCQQRHGQ
ncbi:MAG TPA: hypothetical protein VGF14_03215 [Alphaproteobacteria bacterium]